MIIHVPRILRKEKIKSKLNTIAIVFTIVIKKCGTIAEINRLAQI